MGALILGTLVAVVAWHFGSGSVIGKLLRPESLFTGVLAHAAGNLVVGASAVAILVAIDVPILQRTDGTPSAFIAAVALGVAVALPGSRVVAGVVDRSVSPTELHLATSPIPVRVVTLLSVPASEEVLWRAVIVPGLVALDVPVVAAALAAAAFSVVVHAGLFDSTGDLVKAVAPAALGETVAYLVAGFPAALAVHVLADVEILLTPGAQPRDAAQPASSRDT